MFRLSAGIALCLSLLAATATAAVPVVLDPSETSVDLAPLMDLLIDREGILTFEVVGGEKKSFFI